MLRITVHDNPRDLTFQLEGSLAGPWLRVLEECWQSTLARRRKPSLRVDLTGVNLHRRRGRGLPGRHASSGGRVRRRRLPDKSYSGRDYPTARSRLRVPEWPKRKPAITEPRC